ESGPGHPATPRCPRRRWPARPGGRSIGAGPLSRARHAWASRVCRRVGGIRPCARADGGISLGLSRRGGGGWTRHPQWRGHPPGARLLLPGHGGHPPRRLCTARPTQWEYGKGLRARVHAILLGRSAAGRPGCRRDPGGWPEGPLVALTRAPSPSRLRPILRAIAAVVAFFVVGLLLFFIGFIPFLRRLSGGLSAAELARQPPALFVFAQGAGLLLAFGIATWVIGVKVLKLDATDLRWKVGIRRVRGFMLGLLLGGLPAA